jgi:protein TonB
MVRVMNPASATLAADPAERIVDAGGVAAGKRGRLLVSAMMGVAIQAILIVPLVLEFANPRDFALEESAIPIQVVPEEQPPAAPEEKREQQDERPRTRELDEKIATDAPRKASEDDADKAARDKQSGAPRVDPAPRPKPAEAAATSEASEEDMREAEVIREAGVKTDKPPAPKTPSQPMAMMTMMPAYTAASPTPPATLAFGAADPTYLASVFGQIMVHMRSPPAGRADASGDVGFVVDGRGRLSYSALRRSSGVPELDAAAMRAVREAAPYPPPPIGAAVQLTYHFGAGQEP